MAQLTITVPDPQVPRVLEAFSQRAGKDVADMTEEDARLVLVDLIKRVVASYELEKARQAIESTPLDAT